MPAQGDVAAAGEVRQDEVNTQRNRQSCKDKMSGVKKHLKEDMKEFHEEAAKDKKLISKLKKPR